MGGWRLLLAATALLTAGISCAPINGIDDRVEVHCINEYRRYCQGKPNGLKFSDGCRECKCENGAVLCKKGGCRFFSHPGQDVLDYCETVYRKNAQILASKKKELSELDTRTNATIKANLNLDKVEELTDQEKAEATAKLQKLVETYISNQSDESTSESVEKSPYQMNQEGAIIEEEKRRKRELVALKPPLLQESLFNHSVNPELSELMSESELTYLNNSNSDSYVHPSVSFSNHDAARIYQRKEDYSRGEIPRKRSRHFGSGEHSIHASELRSKHNHEYNTDGVVGDIIVNRRSSWPLHSEHESGQKRSAIYGSPEGTAQGYERSRNRNLMENNWKKGDGKNRMLANAAYRGRYSLPERFERKQSRIIGSSQEDLWDRHSPGFEERHNFISVHPYNGVKHIASNERRNHQRQLFASSQRPLYASRQRTRLEKGKKIGVGSVADSHGGAVKPTNAIKRNRKLIYPDYEEIKNKKHQEILDEVKTFVVLGDIAVNLLISENVLHNNSRAQNVRNASEFKHIVAAIEESIQAVEAEVESFSLQTAVRRQKLLRDISERLNRVVGWTKKAEVMLGGAEALDSIKSEQLNGIIIVMEDIASTLPAAIEKEFGTWNMDNIDEVHYMERKGHLYDDADGNENLAQANEAAALEWKFTHCMMLCSRFLEIA